MSTLALVALAVMVGSVVAVVMEPWARFLHGRVWHGPMWRVHRSHHARRRGRFELNDALSVGHAPPAAALIMIGCNLHGPAAAITLGAGVGMTVFGLAYVTVHDGLIHGRLPVAFLGRVAWLRRICDAHAVHHERGEVPYGLFFGPAELTRAPRAPGAGPSARPRPARGRAPSGDTPPSSARPSA